MATSITGADAIERITTAGRIISEIFRTIERMDLRRMRTIDLNDRIDKIIREHDAAPTFLHYRGFPKSSCISLNNEVVHGIPDGRRIEEGDIVKVDVGVTYKGYIADAARTFPAGDITAEARRLLDVTEKALADGIKAAQSGNKISDISRAVQSHVEQSGYSVVRELTGHGVGRRLHEEPVIPNFVDGATDRIIEKGMALAIEPMVNIGAYDVVTAANGWTIMTRDNSLSCHCEDTVLILERGNANLTRIEEN